MKQLNIFWQFFVLGLFSFGGPMAHISFFRKRFVEKLNWLSDEDFSKIVALSQFLPGPSSSQVGFTIGLKKGGVIGAIIAFIAFTIPSFLLLYIAAVFQSQYSQNDLIIALTYGLKLFAVIVVADATIGMFNSLCKTSISRIIFIFCVLILILFQSFYIQLLVIVLAASFSLVFSKNIEIKKDEKRYIKPYSLPLFLFFVLLIIFPIIANQNSLLELFNSFYQVGSLVFGGGHVVLPLISSNVNIDQNSFLTAYSLAQAVPGPMFTIASYIGAIFYENSPFVGSLIATIAIFLPGFLLILGFYKSFESYSSNLIVSKIIVGVNASVVAILFVTLCLIVIPSAVFDIYDLSFALMGLFLMRKYKLPILLLIVVYCLYGIGFN
jgi:chromate transporter